METSEGCWAGGLIFFVSILKLCTSTAGYMGSVSGLGAKSTHIAPKK